MIEGAVDYIYKVFDPKKYSERLAYRTASEHQMRYRQAMQHRNRKSVTWGLNKSEDSHLSQGDLTTLRESSRRLDRENPFVHSFNDRLQEAVIGSKLNMSIRSANTRWSEKATNMINEWWHGRPEVRGMFSGGALERVLFRAKIVDGDILIVFLDDGNIQIIEGDRVQTPHDKTGDKTVFNGVKLNEYGAILGYWIAPDYDRKLRYKIKSSEFTFVNAKNAHFIASRHRVSMTRGIPKITQNMDLMNDIDEFLNATIVHQKVVASHCLFIERQDPGSENVLTNTDEDGNEVREQFVEPGLILTGRPGESAKILGPNQTAQQFGPVMSQLMRIAGMLYGLPLEMSILDFSQTTFSSARASLEVAHRVFSKQHNDFVKHDIGPVINWKLRQFVRQGVLEEPASTYRIEATPPKKISVDPMKETNADIARILASLDTHEDVCASNGKDYYDIVRQREREILLAQKVASRIVNKTGENWESRDIMGIEKAKAYVQDADKPDTP